MEESLHNVGILGVVNTVALAFIVAMRWSRHFFCNPREIKKNVTYSLLFFSAAVEVPMYISFIVVNEYSLITYSFHKLEAALLFAAYSITLNDWSNVLFEINEDNPRTYLCGRYILFLTNVFFIIISLINFTSCYFSDDIVSYTQSIEYFIGQIFQISAPLVLTIIMLIFGIKLYRRIKPSTSHPSYGQLMQAVRRLTFVMLTCATLVTIQVILAFLNTLLGYSTKENATVGPYYFYWAFYEWIPVWAITLTLLYLNRSSEQSKLTYTDNKSVDFNNNMDYSNPISALIDDSSDLSERLVSHRHTETSFEYVSDESERHGSKSSEGSVSFSVPNTESSDLNERSYSDLQMFIGHYKAITNYNNNNGNNSSDRSLSIQKSSNSFSPGPLNNAMINGTIQNPSPNPSPRNNSVIGFGMGFNSSNSFSNSSLYSPQPMRTIHQEAYSPLFFKSSNNNINNYNNFSHSYSQINQNTNNNTNNNNNNENENENNSLLTESITLNENNKNIENDKV